MEPISTRQASNLTIAALANKIPNLIGGSADLTVSNLTKSDTHKIFNRKNPLGTYIYFGVREHTMVASLTGMSLHGGIIPYGGTFLIFTDYCRPAIRLASIMKQQIIYVMTHDSIGLGEDGPTHQPIEQLASLRAIPNLNVFRPADPIETLECWEVALNQNKPSIISLTRQNIPTIRNDDLSKNLSKQGAYILSETKKGKRDLTILATGSEVSIAIKAKEILEKKGVKVVVVSMPCWEIFDKKSEKYKENMLGPLNIRIAIEAASKFGWSKYLRNDKCILGMENFGASAPSEDLFNHFGLNAKELADLGSKIILKKK